MKRHLYSILCLLAVALGAAGLLTGCQELVQPQNTVPEIATGEAEYISLGEVILRGTTTDYDGRTGRYSFLMSTDEQMADATPVSSQYLRVAGNSVSCRVYYDMQPGTTYYYVLCATDGTVELRGEVRSFTTPANLALSQMTLTDWNDETISLPASYSPLGITLRGGSVNYNNLGWEVSSDGTWTLPVAVAPGQVTEVYAYGPHGELDGNYLYVTTWEGYTPDVIWATPTLNDEASQLSLHFRHAMARVTLHIVLDEAMQDDWLVFSWMLLGGNNTLYTQALLDVRNGQFTDHAAVEGIWHDAPFEVGKESTTDLVFYVIPTPEPVIVPLQLFMDNGTTFDTEFEAYWEAGQAYDYTLRLQRSSLNLGQGITVEPWHDNEGGTIDVNH